MKMSRIESGMRLALAYYEAFNRHDIEAMLGLMSEDCKIECSAPIPDGRVCEGKEATGAQWREQFAETADLHIEIEEIFGLGQRVVAQTRLEWTGADGIPQHLRTADILRIQRGAIRELHSYTKGSPSIQS